jgi:hypothetical protein
VAVAYWRRVGRRGSALLFFAVLDLIYGFSLYRPAPRAVATPAFVFVAGIAPLWAWAVLWWITGCLCLIGAFMRDDSLAWAAAMLIKVLWGAVFLFGWLVAGVERGWVSAAIWLCAAALVALLSSWPEPIGSTVGKGSMWTRRQPH